MNTTRNTTYHAFHFDAAMNKASVFASFGGHMDVRVNCIALAQRHGEHLARLEMRAQSAQAARTAANADGAVTGDGVAQAIEAAKERNAAVNSAFARYEDNPTDFNLEAAIHVGALASAHIPELLAIVDALRAELTRQRERADAAERERDELQAAVTAAVAGVDTLAPLEALTRLLELRRRAGG